MSEPDIIETLGQGVTRTTIIQSVELTRQGKDGGWRISLPMVREVVLPDGSIAPQGSPPVAYDFADLAHDPSVRELYGKLRDLTIRIARGDLKPMPPVHNDTPSPAAGIKP
jgi:hypothetical protein